MDWQRGSDFCLAGVHRDTVPGWGSSVWVVLTADGLELAGTAVDVPVPLLSGQLRQLVSGGIEDTAPELLDALSWRGVDVAAWRSREATEAVTDLPSVALPLTDDVAVTVSLPVVLRIHGGTLTAWAGRSEMLYRLDDRAIAVLDHVREGSLPSHITHVVPDGADALASMVQVGILDVCAHGQRTPASTLAHNSPSAAPRPGSPPEATRTPRSHPPEDPDLLDYLQEVRPRIHEMRRRLDAGRGHGTPVWPAICADAADGSALGLGLVVSAALGHGDGHLASRLSIAPLRMASGDTMEDVRDAGRAGVLLLSTFLWTIEGNLELARWVKSESPGSVIVMGGPSAPKYEDDAARFLEQHPEVDILVRGEGEITLPRLLDRLVDDLVVDDRLADVPGVTFRSGDTIVRTDDAPRLVDFENIVSPYLLGLFDHLPTSRGVWCVESNRGCPYGCTFCDWGSATLSRIRKFDLGRVKAELVWLADRGVTAIFMGDANFGIFARDVEIARYVADLVTSNGSPRWFHVTYAKNSTKYTIQIAEELHRVGLQHEVTAGLQSADSAVLDAIDRKNLPADKFLALAWQARERGIPALADLILGLPESTPATFCEDLEVCLEAGIHPRVFGGMLLANSPMNEPRYRALHEIESDEFGQVVSWHGCPRSGRAEMVAIWDLFVAGYQFGIFRHVVDAAAALSGRRPIDLLTSMRAAALQKPDAVPHLAFLIGAVRRYLAPPQGWQSVIADVCSVLIDETGKGFADELFVAARAQVAVLPVSGGPGERHVDLPHDLAGFLVDHGRSGGKGRLADYPPVSLEITDPGGLCAGSVRQPSAPRFNAQGDRVLHNELGWFDGARFELTSALSRPDRGAFVS